MNTDSLYNEVITRAKNFRWDIAAFEKQISGNESYLFNFSILKDVILEFSSMPLMSELDGKEILQKIAYKLYFTYKASTSDLILFGNESQCSDNVYKAYFFSVLCSFLNTSKQIKGKTLSDFVKKNHPRKFSDPDSPNYYDETLLEDEIRALRKSRNRLLAHGKVYIKNTQWSAISKDAEHEWAFHFELKYAEETVQDVFKRMGNLYNDIDKVLSSPKDDGYTERLKAAYKKFVSKLQKIKYGNYIELIKVILSHIHKDKEYYGLNLYRLERRLQPYKIINEVNDLLACPPGLEDYILWMTVILGDTSFPKLYQDFSSLPCDKAELYAEEFPGFLQDIVISSCLILAEVVKKGTFGNDWENLFRTVMNELAEDVLYDPSQLDFSIKEGSQEKFEKLLAAPVFVALCREAGVNFTHFDMSKVPF